MVRDARRRRAPHHEDLRSHPEEARSVVSKDEATERRDIEADEHDPRDQGSGTLPLEGAAGRHRCARFRRPAPAADGDDGDARARVPARSRGRCRVARRRCAGAGGRPPHRGGRRSGAARGNPRQRSAPSDPSRLASRQPPSADADHAEGPAHPQGSRDRGDGEGTGRPRHRDRSAVRSRRRCLCWPRACRGAACTRPYRARSRPRPCA